MLILLRLVIIVKGNTIELSKGRLIVKEGGNVMAKMGGIRLKDLTALSNTWGHISLGERGGCLDMMTYTYLEPDGSTNGSEGNLSLGMRECMAWGAV